MNPVITIKNLGKEFKVPVKPEETTWGQRLRSLLFRKWVKVKVLRDINLSIEEGEFVAYLGPNGAGKSTTIKLLTGVLSPSSGEINVLGYSPARDRYNYTYHIGVVFGNRTVLDFDIPVIDSFLLYKDIYELSEHQFNERLNYFKKILKIGDLLHVPVRKLSLGQRMRCEIAASLLHKPKVIFLDEPTIGLDAIAKEEIRDFLTDINRREKVTIILTTHDMDDIEALCERIIVIDNGSKIYDGELSTLKKEFIKYKTIECEIKEITNKRAFAALLRKVVVVEQKEHFLHLRVPSGKIELGKVISELLACASIVDLNVHEPRLENVIKEIYQSKAGKKR